MNKPYQVAVSLVVLLFVIFQLMDLNAEYHTMGWWVQQDEKLLVPDARAFYLKGDQKLTDYTEPVSACFGILGPQIIRLGFSLFGFNNFGLRFNFVILSGVATLLLVLLLTRLIPGKLGLLLALFQAVNYKYFVQTRYALPENIVMLFLVVIIWLYFTRQDLSLNWLAFLSGGLILLKQNFPGYCFLLIGSFAIVERFTLKKFTKLLLFSAAGLFVFGCLQTLVLYKMNLLETYVDNIFRAVSQLRGHESDQYLWGFSAPGVTKIIPLFFGLLTTWYVKDIPTLNNVTVKMNYISSFASAVSIILFIGILLLALWLLKEKRLSKITLGLGLFLVFNLLMASQTFFYIKRGLPFFPITLIFFGSLCNDFFNSISKESIKIVFKNATFLLVIILFSVRIFNQFGYIKSLYPKITTSGVEQMSLELDTILPKGSTIYMHCYGLRFAWQTRHRVVSGDDQSLNNNMILRKALNENGRFVLFNSNGGRVDFGNRRNMKLLKTFRTEESDSGYPITYGLYEIN